MVNGGATTTITLAGRVRFDFFDRLVSRGWRLASQRTSMTDPALPAPRAIGTSKESSTAALRALADELTHGRRVSIPMIRPDAAHVLITIDARGDRLAIEWGHGCPCDPHHTGMSDGAWMHAAIRDLLGSEWPLVVRMEWRAQG